MNTKTPLARGLSPSSLAVFTGCNRKYFHKKIAETPIDPDVEEDYEAFEVGKAFHKVLEDCRHELKGLNYEAVRKTVSEFKVADVETSAPLIFAMLAKYKQVHEASRLKAVACEVIIETEAFYGISDVVLLDPASGEWWIGDMKTASTYTAATTATLPRHPQLNLYAAHFEKVAEAANLDPLKYKGCRYRVTTKSKARRKDGEEVSAFINRVSGTIKSLDILIPKEIMAPRELARFHLAAKTYIDENRTKGEEAFPQNFGNCMNFFRPCEFWSKCHGKCNSEMQTLPSIEV